MNKLDNNLGNEVLCLYSKNGIIKVNSGVLKSVNDIGIVLDENVKQLENSKIILVNKDIFYPYKTENFTLLNVINSEGEKVYNYSRNM